MPSASELIVQTLEEAGVEYVFGIPGGGTGQIFQQLHGKEDRIKTILVRHEQVAAIMAEDTSKEGFDVAVRTVQPGATLWAIAEEQFGAGIMYVSVFEANKDQIRDPDLIYPGQVFRIPEIAE